MSLKTVGTLTWEACKTCRHGKSGYCDMEPQFDYIADDVECTDYLSNEESEEEF